MTKLKKYQGKCLIPMAVLMAFLTSSAVQAQVVIPDVGVDVDGLLTAIATLLGAIVASVLGFWGAFWVVKKGIKQFNKVG